MTAHILQHVPFEGPASIELWLADHGIETRYARLFESTRFPDPAAGDLVVVLGGPMSVNDERLYPWLRQEKDFIRNAINADLAVVGICLGAQLIAGAMGARVCPMERKEIGWFPVNPVSNGADVFRISRPVTAFHWHGEMFDLPDGSVRTAESAACANQAFQLGRRVIGLQFHLESTPGSVDQLVRNCGKELVADRYVQTGEELRAASDRLYTRINNLMGEVLTYVSGVS